MSRSTTTLWCLVACACSSPEARPVQVDLAVHSSCGTSLSLYDISCVNSLEVLVRDGADPTRIFASRCTAINGYLTINDLLTADRVTVIPDLEPRNNVIVELRGYHTLEDTPCGELLDSSLMLWGASDPTNLEDINQTEVTVTMECRPDCDCVDFDNVAACTAELITNVCVPSIPSRSCEHTCTTDEDCFGGGGGALTCDFGTCVSASMCATGCTSQADCEPRICVRNNNNGETFCADPCPPIPDPNIPEEDQNPLLSACFPKMKCRHLETSCAADSNCYNALP